MGCLLPGTTPGATVFSLAGKPHAEPHARLQQARVDRQSRAHQRMIAPAGAGAADERRGQGAKSGAPARQSAAAK